MKYFVDNSVHKPAYIQLYEQIRSDITEKILPFMSKLPSKRLLSEEVGVSVITAEHAYAILIGEGYIESRERSGYFVIYNESDFVSASEKGKSAPVKAKTINSAGSEFPYSVLSKTMRSVMLDIGENLLEKSPNKGLSELRGAIADYLLRNQNIRVRTEQIVIGSGAEYLYSLAILLLGRERIYAVEEPCYDQITKVYKANNITFEHLKLSSGGIKTALLEKSNADVLHVTPFNSYPSGISADASKRIEYIRWAKKRDGFIIEDNYDSEMTVSKKNDDTLFSLSGGENVIYMNTFSKTVAPSIRVGYMLLPENLTDEFEKKLGFFSCTVPVFEQYLLTYLLQNGDFERHINRVRRKKRKLLAEGK